MTNEDKAFAYANKNFEAYSHDEDPLDALRDGFLCGTEWKDQQFKEYLEKKIEPFIRTNASPQGTYQEGFDDGYTSAIDEIINELFGETEQDNSDREE